MRFRCLARSWLVITTTAVIAVSGSGCWGSGGSGPHAEWTGGPPPTGAGKISIAWTVGAEAASDASCAGIDHLTLELAYHDGNGLSISPIPCTIGRLRYDQIPEGDADLTLSAFDATGCETRRGQAAVTVRTTLPPSPSPTVALSPATRCR